MNSKAPTVPLPLRIGHHPGPRVQGVELAIFLFLIVPSMAFSFLAIKQGIIGFGVTAVATIFRDLSLVALILFFLWRNGERVVSLGWRPEWKDVGVGAVLFVPFFLFSEWFSRMLESVGFSAPSALPISVTPHGSSQLVLACFLVLVVAVAEETIFRGYLILRFQAISNSPVIAVVASAFVFSLGHGYEGSAGVLTVGVMGLLFGLVYLWRRSLVAPMTMHLLQDLVAIVLPALLGPR